MSQIASPTRTAGQKPTVLILLGAFWPGHEATGPNQSIRALAEELRDDFIFRIVARDRARGAANSAVPTGVWLEKTFAQVLHCRPGVTGVAQLAAVLRTTIHDLVILNGFFDRGFTIPFLLMRRAGLIKVRPTILSPRGDLSAGDRFVARPHKLSYIRLARSLDLFKGVAFHATATLEAGDIRRWCGQDARIYLAPNNRRHNPVTSGPSTIGRGGHLRLVYCSRIDRKKNLLATIRALATSSDRMVFDIYGPISDHRYWTACQRAIAELPSNIVATYRGVLSHASVSTTLQRYDAFVLMTDGENFGHAIADALEVGLPVIISDRTPWTHLQRNKAGWNVSVEDPAALTRALAEMCRMTTDEREVLRRGARALFQVTIQASRASELTATMMKEVIGNASEPAIVSQTGGCLPRAEWRQRS